MKFIRVDDNRRSPDGDADLLGDAQGDLLADLTIFVADSDLPVSPTAARNAAERWAGKQGRTLGFRRETIEGRQGTLLWLEAQG